MQPKAWAYGRCLVEESQSPYGEASLATMAPATPKAVRRFQAESQSPCGEASLATRTGGSISPGPGPSCRNPLTGKHLLQPIDALPTLSVRVDASQSPYGEASLATRRVKYELSECDATVAIPLRGSISCNFRYGSRKRLQPIGVAIPLRGSISCNSVAVQGRNKTDESVSQSPYGEASRATRHFGREARPALHRVVAIPLRGSISCNWLTLSLIEGEPVAIPLRGSISCNGVPLAGVGWEGTFESQSPYGEASLATGRELYAYPRVYIVGRNPLTGKHLVQPEVPGRIYSRAVEVVAIPLRGSISCNIGKGGI